MISERIKKQTRDNPPLPEKSIGSFLGRDVTDATRESVMYDKGLESMFKGLSTVPKVQYCFNGPCEGLQKPIFLSEAALKLLNECIYNYAIDESIILLDLIGFSIFKLINSINKPILKHDLRRVVQETFFLFEGIQTGKDPLENMLKKLSRFPKSNELKSIRTLLIILRDICRHPDKNTILLDNSICRFFPFNKRIIKERKITILQLADYIKYVSLISDLQQEKLQAAGKKLIDLDSTYASHIHFEDALFALREAAENEKKELFTNLVSENLIKAVMSNILVQYCAEVLRVYSLQIVHPYYPKRTQLLQSSTTALHVLCNIIESPSQSPTQSFTSTACWDSIQKKLESIHSVLSVGVSKKFPSLQALKSSNYPIYHWHLAKNAFSGYAKYLDKSCDTLHGHVQQLLEETQEMLHTMPRAEAKKLKAKLAVEFSDHFCSLFAPLYIYFILPRFIELYIQDAFIEETLEIEYISDVFELEDLTLWLDQFLPKKLEKVFTLLNLQSLRLPTKVKVKKSKKKTGAPSVQEQDFQIDTSPSAPSINRKLSDVFKLLMEKGFEIHKGRGKGSHVLAKRGNETLTIPTSKTHISPGVAGQVRKALG